MQHKSLSRVEIKDEDRGEVAAVFSTFNHIDSDGDVTLKGAFTDGAPVAISPYGHSIWKGSPPVGKGAIRELETEAVMEGRYFMDTQRGRDEFVTVKAMSDEATGNIQEWSYGLLDIQSERGQFEGKSVRFLKSVRVPEVSPVMVGAGITRTLATKGQKFSEHASSVLADVDALITRASEVMALRAQKGKSLSGESTDLLSALSDELDRLKELIEGDGEAPPPETDDAAAALVNEYLRFVEHSQGVIQ